MERGESGVCCCWRLLLAACGLMLLLAPELEPRVGLAAAGLAAVFVGVRAACAEAAAATFLCEEDMQRGRGS